MSSPNPLVRPSRSAHAAIGGYLYQTCLGVLRWLDLADGEVLLCEGDEDLDRLIAHGIGTSEQVKALGDGVSIRDRVVTESLRQFLLSYVTLRQRGEERRFVFTTTARRRRQRTDDELAVDVLASWSEATRDAEKRDAVIAALRRLLPPKDDGRPATDELRRAVEDAFAWLDREEDRWTGFLGSVEWTFEAPDTGGVRGRIADRLSARPQTRALPLEDVIDRLVAELLEAATRPEPVERTRTREDLTRFFASLETELASWAATPRAARLRAMFDELGQVGKLLHDGTRELPERGFGPGKLLTAAYEVIPFDEHGRRDELDALAAWCNHERSTSVWLWTGEGGTGKSRLLIEWCRRLAAQGWHTGFLHPNRTAADIARLLRGVVPRLVVVDYAETRLEVVKPFLREMALTRDDGPKLRLVLLARRKADWWQALGRDDESVEDLLLESPAPRELAALVGRGAAREAAFRRASTAFAEALPSELPDPLPVPDLDRDDFDRVLYLHMAALAAAGGERIGDAHDALERTLQHEHRFWQKEISGLVGGDGVAAQALEEAVEPVVAALTLVGGAGSETEARALVERVISGGARRDDVRVALPGLLRRLYGGSPERGGRHLEGLQPDLLGEELVAASLSREASLLERVIDGADAGGRSQLLTVLARLARRRPEAEEWLDGAFREHLEELAEIALAVAVESGDPVGMVLARQVESGASVELAERLMRRCDRADYLVSVPLREVAFGATRKCLEAHRSRWPEPGEEQLAERAGIANNLGSRLRDLGRREDALEATCEAVDIRRQLAASRPDAFLPDLATSLNNLGKMLSDLGRRDEALEATREAVDIRRRLAESRPDDFLSDLAMSLNNLGKMLSDLGHRDEALEATREAVEHNRQLAESRLDDFRPDLAMTLNNLGLWLSDLGRREDALEATREAVEHYRQLAAVRPDAFRPYLAQSLNNLGSDLSKLGRREDALEATRQAVDIRRQLAESRPEAFLPNLAVSLNNLGAMLSDLGCREEALEAAEEAVCRLAPFFLRYSDAYREWMTGMVQNYYEYAEAAGQEPDAELLKPINDVLEATRSVASSNEIEP